MLDARMKEIADKADMIIRGFAFTRNGDFIRVLNLNDGESSMMMTPDGMMVESNMNEIEQAVVQNIWKKNAKYMEA